MLIHSTNLNPLLTFFEWKAIPRTILSQIILYTSINKHGDQDIFKSQQTHFASILQLKASIYSSPRLYSAKNNFGRYFFLYIMIILLLEFLEKYDCDTNKYPRRFLSDKLRSNEYDYSAIKYERTRTTTQQYYQ